MAYVIEFYWIYLLAALVFGGIVGWMTWQFSRRPGLFQTWAGWGFLIFLIALVIALLKTVADRGGFYLELALLFFAVYIAGCWLGGALRALFAPARQDLAIKPATAVASGGLATAAAGAGAGGAAVARTSSAPPAAVTPASVPAPVAAPAAAAPAIPAPSGPKPVALSGPLGGKADDLKLISGIGRQNEEKLHGLGVYHFRQIAEWTPENVKWTGEFMAFPGRIEREKWVDQAKQLAAGQQTDFARRVTSGAVPTSLTTEAAAAHPDAHPGDKPVGITAARGGKPDDLKRISGVGRQNEERLNGLGIFHFDQIAAWSASNAQWVGSFMAFPGRIEREKWVEQASQLAAGLETDFSKRVDSGSVPTSQNNRGDKKN